MTDENIIVREQGRIFLAGLPLVEAATGEEVDDGTLGGGQMHSSESGVTDHLAHDNAHAIAIARGIVADLGIAGGRAVEVISLIHEAGSALSHAPSIFNLSTTGDPKSRLLVKSPSFTCVVCAHGGHSNCYRRHYSLKAPRKLPCASSLPL